MAMMAASLRALTLAAGVPSSLPKPSASASPAPFLVLLSPALPRVLTLRSTRPRLPLAASDSFFDSSVEVAEPDVAEDEALETVAEEEPAAVAEEEEKAVEAVEEVEEVGEYVEPPEEATAPAPFDPQEKHDAQAAAVSQDSFDQDMIVVDAAGADSIVPTTATGAGAPGMAGKKRSGSDLGLVAEQMLRSTRKKGEVAEEGDTDTYMEVID